MAATSSPGTSGGKAPTVYDVADRASVSIATVSRVLRTPDAVREATRERVMTAVRDLGYVPSGNARALAGRRTGVIGLCFPGHDGLEGEDPRDEAVRDPRPAMTLRGGVRIVDDRRPGPAPAMRNLYFDEVLRGAEVEAWRRGFALMVAAGRGPSREVIVNDIAGRVDGLAVLARTVSDDLLAHVARRIPVVVLADATRADGFDHVSVDNAAGMQALTTHVVTTLGVRDVVYVAGPQDSPDEAERRRGFLAALTAAGVAPETVPVLRGDFRGDRAFEAVTRLLRERIPRALVCANDQSALGALDAVRAGGLSVPGDVLVTGFDGIDVSRFTEPPLTTVAQPMAELGRAAVRAIVDRLALPQAPRLDTRLPVEVLLRESCPPTL
ncbi:LacI family DNA-binding transcriptional regulator [Kineococcus sp. R86509]|uniref:LacI family DNA-binding transcriptional regulator n=1 Tax=Kineococcus sp. R86509 TaxID=3093851 RepID=UPI0036D36283